MISTKTGAFVTAVVVLLALLYNKKEHEPEERERLDQVLSGLLRAERKISLHSSKVAIGFGGCKDILVEALPLLDKLGIDPPTDPRHYDTVEKQEELAELLAYFFRYGAAAERYISNETLFSELTEMAVALPGMKSFLGGNAPVMARRLANMGADVLLAASLGKELEEAMPDNVRVVGNGMDKDDIHLLLEYKAGAKWGKYTSPRANRLIVHSDNSNPQIDTLENLEREIVKFDPSVLVVGGLQMMDNFPFETGVREERLLKLRNLLARTSRKTNIHFEMASFTDKVLLQQILNNVVLYSDSLGMNEQELPNLVSMLTDGKISLIADAYPRIASVLDQMRLVYKLLKNTDEVDGRRRLSRLHVHTLAYQAILTTKGSSWRNTMSAAAIASLTANRHVCGSNYIDLMKAKLIMDESFSTSKTDSAQRIPLKESRPVSCWEEDDFEICLAPVLVCTEVMQTAGGGDNISSAGLLVQVD